VNRNAEQRRGAANRFVSRFSDDDLLEIVRAVCADLVVNHGLTLTDINEAAFDAGLAVSRWPDAPKADRISRRLNHSWGQLMAMLGADRDVHFNAALKRRRKRTKGSKQESVHALQVVAAHLAASTLSQVAYRQGRESYQTAHRRRRSTVGNVGLPPMEQIKRHFHGDWGAALAAAGLDGFDPYGGRLGVRPQAAIDAFLRDVGCLPWSLRALREYCHQRDLALGGFGTGYRDEADAAHGFDRELYAYIGPRLYGPQWVPFGPPLPGERPEITVGDAELNGRPRLRRGEFATREEVVQGLAIGYRIAAERGLNFNQKFHQALAAANRDVPSQNVVQLRATKTFKTTAAKLREEARKLALEELAAEDAANRNR
jgi:hypothetical protein